MFIPSCHNYCLHNVRYLRRYSVVFNLILRNACWIVIRVKRIYNFLLFHATYMSLLHVFITLLHNFLAFCRTNLLTRCPVPIPCFCCFLFQKSYLRKYSRNWTIIYKDFYSTKGSRRPKGDLGGHPGVRGGLWPRTHLHP